jgi:Ca2+-binding EF-hand superfamily protein
MGNEQGKTNTKMGIQAVAYTTSNIDAAEMTEMMEKIVIEADKTESSGRVTKTILESVLNSIEKFESGDREILMSIFTMLDVSGEAMITQKEFISGVAGTLLLGTAAEKLSLAIKLSYYPAENDAVIMADLRKVLNTINNVVSYFGDPVVTSESVEVVVKEVFQNQQDSSTPMPIGECVDYVLKHPVTDIFLSGNGTVRFGR